jgi:hypothetical protein
MMCDSHEPGPGAKHYPTLAEIMQWHPELIEKKRERERKLTSINRNFDFIAI